MRGPSPKTPTAKKGNGEHEGKLAATRSFLRGVVGLYALDDAHSRAKDMTHDVSGDGQRLVTRRNNPRSRRQRHRTSRSSTRRNAKRHATLQNRRFEPDAGTVNCT
jgi:hypothetical protein